jgi:hypothetical protein
MPKKGKKTLEVEEVRTRPSMLPKAANYVVRPHRWIAQVEDDFDFSDEDDLELGDELDGEGDDDDLLLGEEGEDVGEESRLADTDNPFRKDPASYTIFSSITSKRYRNKIKRLANELHEYAELHQVRPCLGTARIHLSAASKKHRSSAADTIMVDVRRRCFGRG